MVEALVRKLSRYAALSEAELASLRALPSTVQEFARGGLIAEEGDLPRQSAVMLSGLSIRFRLLPSGSRQIMAIHIPGDFVDLHSFVLHPLDHGIGVLSPSRVARVPQDALDLVLERHPRLTKALMWDMALDGATCREWLVGLGRRPALERMAHLICELYYRMRLAGLLQADGFDLPVSQQDLADICGLSAVHVNRSLQSLRQQGMIVTDRSRVTVPDIERLCKAAGFDPAYLHLIARPLP